MGVASNDPGPATGSDDPIRRRRATVGRWVALASRTGYALLAVAVVAFFVALATEFNGTMATIVVAALIAASILLAPAIVLGYAVRAAERDDRERGL
jgi:hypothetical protein